MSDGSHSNAVRLQALALIVAALLTTTGAVTSAFIQSGWFKTFAGSEGGRVAVAVPQVAPRAQAMFTGGIEPLEETSFAVNSPTVISPLVKMPAVAVESFSPGFAEQNENLPTAFYEAVPKARLQSRSESAKANTTPAVVQTAEPPRIEVPRVLTAPTISKPLMSTRESWFSAIPTIFLQPAPRLTAPSASANTAKPRPSNWTPLSH